jgi:hypothetical protein
VAESVTGNPDWFRDFRNARIMPDGYKIYQSLLLFTALYLLRNVLFGIGAGDDRSISAKRVTRIAGNSLLWIVAIRWPMMLCAILGCRW